MYAAYPERTEPIPGCGRATETTYEQIIEFAAFYCPDGDFLVYDDGEDGVLYSLTEEFGPTILGVVMAHEFGHAIQSRPVCCVVTSPRSSPSSRPTASPVRGLRTP